MGLTEIERRAADATRAHNRFIGSEIRRIREDAGVSLRRLAEAAGVSRSF
jgi:DNA-binding transcriptional regulator YiaG